MSRGRTLHAPNPDVTSAASTPTMHNSELQTSPLLRLFPTTPRQRATRHSSATTKMKPDDLPMYPTPQQATYTIPPQNLSLGARRHPKPQQYQQVPPQHANYEYNSPPSSYSAPAQPQYNRQSLRTYPQQQLNPQQQYYKQQPSYQAPNYQNGYQAPPPAHQQVPLSHGMQQNAAPQQYYQDPPHAYQPPLSASSSHYSNTSPQYASFQNSAGPQNTYSSSPHAASVTSAPPPVQTGLRHGSSSSQAAPQARPPPQKKPQQTNRSKESLDEDKKSAAKQRLESELRATFERVDTNRLGKISARELSAALINFDNTGFQHSTVKLMIKLFTSPSSSSSGLNFEQFVSLWKYLTAYKKLFAAADVNKSGDISFGEFQRIIDQIGYKLNVDLVLHLFQKFANKELLDDGSVAVGKLKFDAFIELLVYLRKLTDIFKQYDKDLSGVATIDYLDFLFEISNLT